jgi:hypothetical protein
LDHIVLSVRYEGKSHVAISLAGGPLDYMPLGVALSRAAGWSIVGQPALAEHIRQAVCMALRGEFGEVNWSAESTRPAPSIGCRAASFRGALGARGGRRNP